MKTNCGVVRKQTGKVVLAAAKAVGNATIPVSATPFARKDTLYYQVEKHGDYVQEQGG
jgi:hypothetical protein